ncbi:MAG: histidine phosphatase family protein, partial [Candidatus Dormibacteraeota bacterium]|nr:histidine phosphatase family protein [Candidatus Dormibacteraeota bacterium]
RTDTRLREVRTHWDEGGVGRVNEPGVYPFPEPADEVVGRVGASVWDIAGGLPEPAGRRPRAVVVGHNAAIAIFCQHVMGVSWGAVPIFLQYTSVSVLVAAGDRMVVQSLADITHLAASRSSVRAS